MWYNISAKTSFVLIVFLSQWELGTSIRYILVWISFNCMSDKAGKLEAIIKRSVKEHEPLDTHTILKVPAIAEMYLEIDAQDVLIKTINAARSLGLPVYLLGSGTRIESGKNIKGLVIKNLCRRFEKASMKGTIKKNEIGFEHMKVYAQAGALMNQLVRFTIEEGLSGLEYQLGLPGTVG